MADIEFGPIEFLALEFPDDRIPDAVKTELAVLVASEQVRIIDLVVVRRPVDGDLEIIEIQDLEDEIVVTDVELPGSGLAGQEDIDEIAGALPLGSSALILVIEHLWSLGLARALRASGGILLASERIPAEVVAALSELEELAEELEDELDEELDEAAGRGSDD